MISVMRSGRRTIWTVLAAALGMAVTLGAIGVAVNYATDGVSWVWWPVLVGLIVASGLLAAFLEHRRSSSDERHTAAELIDFLMNKRVLWTPMIDEIPHEAIKSILEIRERVVADRRKLRDPTAQQALDMIRDESMRLLEAPRDWFASLFFPPEGDSALRAFRGRVRPAISSLALIYQVRLPKWGEFRGGFEDDGEAKEFYVPEPNWAKELRGLEDDAEAEEI